MKKHARTIEQTSFLVTGGAGFIGSHIVEELLQAGAKKVVAIDNFANGNWGNVNIFKHHPNYQFIEGDIRDAVFCKDVCSGIDAISHQAALGSIPRSINDPITTTEVNVNGFLNILVAAQQHHIKRLVFASSSSVYGSDANLPKKEHRIGKPLSPYAITKLSNEHYARVFGQIHQLETIGLRYFNIFGPRQNPKVAYAAVIPLFIEGLLQGTSVYINGKGDQTRDFTFVKNAARANVLALTTTQEKAYNQVFNVAVGERYSVLHLFESLATILNSAQQPIFLAPRQGDMANSLADISKARRLLGYEPLVRFGEGLEQTVAYFVAQQSSHIPTASALSARS
jgi:UDP-N-acetylglucosamine 4-epimerase